jgi:hypothetical protein
MKPAAAPDLPCGYHNKPSRGFWWSKWPSVSAWGCDSGFAAFSGCHFSEAARHCGMCPKPSPMFLAEHVAKHERMNMGKSFLIGCNLRASFL